MSDDSENSIPEEGFKPDRRRLEIRVGEFVQDGKKVYRIEQVLDHQTVVGAEVETGRKASLRIPELRPLEETSLVIEDAQDLEQIADEDWRVAQERYAAIRPLIGPWKPGRAQVEKRAEEVGASPATLYRWLNRYRGMGTVTALIPKNRGWRKGKRRISKHAEGIVREVLKDYLGTRQRPSGQKVIREVKRRAFEQGIDAPSPSTIRNRISEVSEKQLLRSQGYRDLAINKFQPAAGRFPGGEYPLGSVQIDHTQADIILVDDQYRQPIGRPWISLAIDVYSRMIIGYYLALEEPSELSVAMCVSHAVLPKDEWLALHEIDAEWPVWGFPETIHVDNGPDFRAGDFQKACERYGVNLEYRPAKVPRYGGHIERLIGSIMDRVHDLPGTTFSSVGEREDYDAEKEATFTLADFERWLVTLILKDYHENIHSSLGMAPRKQWEVGIFGNAEVAGVGMPPRPVDRLTIQLDFLPAFRRTIQTFGVTIDNLTYYDEGLRPWFQTKDPERPHKKQKFVFRRDPRDISVIWFFDPKLEQYFRIPVANRTLPAMSAWEHRRAQEKLKQEGKKDFNENQIMRALTELREQEEAAKAKTKKARRQAQQRKNHERKITPAEPTPKPKQTAQTENLPKGDEGSSGLDLAEGDIPDFGDFE